MAKQEQNFTWEKGAPRQKNFQLGAVVNYNEYLCQGHDSLIGISIGTLTHPELTPQSAISILSNDPNLLTQIQPNVSLSLDAQGTLNRATMTEGPPYEIKIAERDSDKQSPQFMVDMIKAVDAIVPVPSWVKSELANTYHLDKEQLGVDKEKTAAEIAYAGTMLTSINRQTGSTLPLEALEHIAKFAITKDNLTPSEESRSARYGTEKPNSLEEMKQETKESFAKKVLDEYQKKDNNSKTR